MGEGENVGLRLHFDGHLRLRLNGAKVTTDAGLLVVGGRPQSHIRPGGGGEGVEVSKDECKKVRISV